MASRNGIQSPAEARVLRVLKDSPGLSGASVIEEVDLNRHAVYSALTRLRQAGLIKTARGYGSSQAYHPTRAGHRALARSAEYYQSLAEQLA